MAASNGEESIVKTVRIRPDQDRWLDARAVNFSELMRRLLDAYIAQEDGSRRDPSAQNEAAAVNA